MVTTKLCTQEMRTKGNPISNEAMNKLIEAWKHYLQAFNDWCDIISRAGDPKRNSCGDIYVPPDPLCREKEDFAIADMRNIEFAHPLLRFLQGSVSHLHSVL